MTRFWRQGRGIQVKVVNDLPIQIEIDAVMHLVLDIEQRWRIDEGWWSQRVWRDYFKLHTHEGWFIEIYQDLTNQKWYLQRVYD